MKAVLILGGTTEARELASNLAGSLAGRARVITSLAGVLTPSSPPPGELHVGSFGDATGLVDYIRDEGISVLVDATHPYATNITRQATVASVRAEIPKLQLIRKQWPQPAGSKWADFPDIEILAARLAGFSSRALLTIGSRGPKAFEGINGVHFVVRMIEAPKEPLNIPSHEVVLARPPFDIAGEKALMEKYEIDTLVTKNAGGQATAAKIFAAADLGIKIACVERPMAEPGEKVETVAEAQAWVENRL